jgi:hypothetical protein
MDTTQNATPKPDLSTVGPLGIDNGDHQVRKKELIALLAVLFPQIAIHEFSDAIDRAGGK